MRKGIGILCVFLTIEQLLISCGNTKKITQEDRSSEEMKLDKSTTRFRQKEMEMIKSSADSNINEINGLNFLETNIFQDSLGNKTTRIRQITYSKTKNSNFSFQKENQLTKEKNIDSLSIIASHKNQSIKKINIKEQKQNSSNQYIWIIIIIVIVFFILNIF